jgi:hypothetical protein
LRPCQNYVTVQGLVIDDYRTVTGSLLAGNLVRQLLQSLFVQYKSHKKLTRDRIRVSISDTSASARLRNDAVLGRDILQNFAHKTSTNLGLSLGVEQRLTLKQDVKVETELSRLTLGSLDGFCKLINERRVLSSGMRCCVM